MATIDPDLARYISRRMLTAAGLRLVEEIATFEKDLVACGLFSDGLKEARHAVYAVVEKVSPHGYD